MKKIKLKAIRMAEKEFLDVKRKKVTDILNQKLLHKYGPHSEKPVSTGIISKVVDEFLTNNPSFIKITDIRKIAELEQLISSSILKRQEEEKSVAAIRKVKSNEKVHLSNSNEDHPNLNSAKYNQTEKSSTKSNANMNDEQAVILNKVNPWTLIDTFRVVEGEELVTQEKQKAAQKRKEMVSSLDQHVRQKEDEKQVEKSDDEKFVEIQRKSLKEWEKNTKKTDEIEKKKVLQLWKARHEQVEETMKRTQNEFAQARASELQEIEGIKISLEKEEEDLKQKKIEERQKWERIKVENAQKIEESRIRKEEEARMDAKLMADMKEKFDKEEAKRLKAIEDRENKAKMYGKMLKEAGAFKKTDEMVVFEKALLKQAGEREKMKGEEEEKKQRMLKEKIISITESNRQMAEERKRQEKKVEEEEEAYAIQCLREKEALLKEEEEKRMRQQQTKEKYRETLQEQIEEQRRQNHSTDMMTNVERSMNKKLMTTIESPNVRTKLLGKLKITQSPQLSV